MDKVSSVDNHSFGRKATRACLVLASLGLPFAVSSAEAAPLLLGSTITISAVETDSLFPGRQPDLYTTATFSDLGNPGSLTLDVDHLDRSIITIQGGLQIAFRSDDTFSVGTGNASYGDYGTPTFDVTISGLDGFTVTGASPFSFANGVFSFDTTNDSFANGDNGFSTFQLSAAAVPEPASWAMMLGGLGLLGGALRRQRRSVCFA